MARQWMDSVAQALLWHGLARILASSAVAPMFQVLSCRPLSLRRATPATVRSIRETLSKSPQVPISLLEITYAFSLHAHRLVCAKLILPTSKMTTLRIPLPLSSTGLNCRLPHLRPDHSWCWQSWIFKNHSSRMAESSNSAQWLLGAVVGLRTLSQETTGIPGLKSLRCGGGMCRASRTSIVS